MAKSKTVAKKKLILAFIEAIKEPTRMFLLGVISFFLVEGINLIVVSILGVNADPNLKLMLVGGLTYGFRALDKYLHEIGKITKDENLIKGLTRF